MGGKKKGGGGHNFGRALIKDRFGRGNRTLNSDSFVRSHCPFIVDYLIVNLLLKKLIFMIYVRIIFLLYK